MTDTPAHMMQKQETFDQYLERSLANANLRSYGHNEYDQEAELMCYQRAVDCFFPEDGTVPRSSHQGINWHQLLGHYPNGAPAPATVPPWGIHAIDPEDAPHEASLANDGANPKDKAASTKVPMWSLPAIGAVHGAMSTADGIRKGYGAYNWRYNPISMMEHIGALERHIAALKDGEDFTSDSNVTHLGCVIAGASIILDAHQCGTLDDDRPRPGITTSADALEDYHDRNTDS